MTLIKGDCKLSNVELNDGCSEKASKSYYLGNQHKGEYNSK